MINYTEFFEKIIQIDKDISKDKLSKGVSQEDLKKLNLLNSINSDFDNLKIKQEELHKVNEIFDFHFNIKLKTPSDFIDKKYFINNVEIEKNLVNLKKYLEKVLSEIDNEMKVISEIWNNKINEKIEIINKNKIALKIPEINDEIRILYSKRNMGNFDNFKSIENNIILNKKLNLNISKDDEVILKTIFDFIDELIKICDFNYLKKQYKLSQESSDIVKALMLSSKEIKLTQNVMDSIIELKEKLPEFVQNIKIRI